MEVAVIPLRSEEITQTKCVGNLPEVLLYLTKQGFSKCLPITGIFPLVKSKTRSKTAVKFFFGLSNHQALLRYFDLHAAAACR
jgi:hypothetical protein